jgi:T5SS/PEP-CTERM-associated repeat protein
MALVGQSGTGVLHVTQGGQVASVSAQVGYGMTGAGTVGLSDVSSRWDIQQTLTVGGLGAADMTIQNGARVVSGRGVIGQASPATGQVTVSGSGSLLACTGYGDLALTVGEFGQGTLTIADGAVVVSGKGFIGKQASGGGTVTMTGYGSRWSNHAGALAVGGSASGTGGDGQLTIGAGSSVDADAVTIWPSGTVQGGGTLTSRSTVTNYGALKPGDGLGTLTLDGDLILMPGSTVEIEVDNHGRSDCVTVTDSLTIAGGTLKAVSTETITEEHIYTVMQAEQISGQFDVLDTALLHTTLEGTDPVLSYGHEALTLRIAARPFTDAALTQTPNQSAVGSALQAIADAGGNTLTTELQQLGEDRQVRDAYDQLSGQSYLGVTPVTLATTDRFQGLASERLGQARSSFAHQYRSPMIAQAGDSRSSSPDSVYDVNPLGPVMALGYGSDLFADRAWGIWAKGYGLFGDRETKANSFGYGYQVLGGGVGLDYHFTDSWMFGITGGCSEGDIDYTNRSSADFDGTYTGLYGTYDRDTWYVDGVLTLARMDYATQRQVTVGTSETLSGQFDGTEYGASIEAGFDWEQPRDWRVQPLAGFRFSRVNLEGYTESGGSSALTYNAQHYQSYRASLGLKLTHYVLDNLGRANTRVEIRGRWNHEFNDTKTSVDTSFASNPGTVFTVTDENLSRDSGVVGIGFHTQVSRHAEIRLDYDTRFSTGDQSHLITGLVEIRW